RGIVHRRSTRAAHSFPSLHRFLTLAPACWSREKFRRTRAQVAFGMSWRRMARRKGKRTEGRSGGSGRGTRRELWAHLTAVLQPRSEERRGGKEFDPRRSPISFPPTLPHPRTCLLVTGTIPPHTSARSARHSCRKNVVAQR